MSSPKKKNHFRVGLLIVLLLFPLGCSPVFFRVNLWGLFYSTDARQWSLLRSPFLVTDHHIYFFQPDSTFTGIVLDTGVLVCRDVSLRSHFEKENRFTGVNVYRWSTVGRIAYSDDLSGFIMLDTKTGIMDLTYFPGGVWMADPAAHGNNLFFHDSEKNALLMIDADTKKKSEICELKWGDFGIMNDRLFVFHQLRRSAPEQLECYDPADGSLLWSRGPANGTVWRGMACNDGKIFVFSVSRESYYNRNKDAEIDTILVYDIDGEMVDEEKADVADFGGKWPKTYSYPVFRGVKYRRSRPQKKSTIWDEMRDDRKIAEQRLGRKVWNPVFLHGEQGVVGIEYDKNYADPDGSPKIGYKIYFVDDEKISWEARINSMDDWLQYDPRLIQRGHHFRFAVTDRHVIFSTPNAKVECLDRKTGRSLWLYSFPGLDYQRWVYGDILRYKATGWERWGRDTYITEFAAYEKSLAPDLQTPATVRGDTSPSTSRVITDPDPLPFPRALIAPFIAWFLPVFSIFLIFRNLRAKKVEELNLGASRSIKVIWLSVAAYSFLGRYSAPTLAATLIVLILATAMVFYYRL